MDKKYSKSVAEFQKSSRSLIIGLTILLILMFAMIAAIIWKLTE